MDSCLVVKQDGLRLLVSIAVDLLEKVPIEGRRFPRKQSVEEGEVQVPAVREESVNTEKLSEQMRS